MRSLELELGRYDDLNRQLQADYTVDLCKSNLAIFGSAMSGKTTLVKTLLVRLHQRAKVPENEEVYILDFSSNLILYKELPCVVGYFDGSREENVRRVFRRVEERLSENIKNLHGKVYAELGSDESDERDPKKNRIIHVTLILDGLNAFYGNERYASYQDELLKLARDGLSKGVTVVVTATDTSAGGARLLNCFGRMIALDIPPEKYTDIFGFRVEKPPSMKGRGIANQDGMVYEFHGYFPYDSDRYTGDEGEKKSLIDMEAVLREHIKDYDAFLSRQMRVFTDTLNKENWKDFCPHAPSFTPCCLTVGLDYYTFDPVTVDLRTARCIAIYGRKGAGKTNLLRLLLRGAKKIPNVRFVLWDDGRKELDKVKDLTDGVDTRRVTNRQGFEALIQEYFDLPENIYSAPSEENSYSFSDPGDPENMVFPPRPTIVPVEERPFTIFVMQSREVYQNIPGGSGRHLLVRMQPFIDSAASEKALFVFSDVQRLTDADTYTYFNYTIAQAFLLYDIVSFVRDRGNGTVFSNMDQTELKERFGLCDQGDGFLYDLEKADIQKIKFIKDQ